MQFYRARFSEKVELSGQGRAAKQMVTVGHHHVKSITLEQPGLIRIAYDHKPTEDLVPMGNIASMVELKHEPQPEPKPEPTPEPKPAPKPVTRKRAKKKKRSR